MKKPLLCSKWNIIDAGNAILVASEEDFHVFADPVTRRLAPLLTGEATTETIIEALAGDFEQSAVRAAISELERHGLIRDGGQPARAEAAYWEFAGVDPVAAAARRSALAVRVLATGDASFDGVVSALEALGIAIDERAEFSILVTRNYLDPAIGEFSKACWADGRSWMLTRPYGLRQWIGPLVIPGRPPCWDCLSRALITNGYMARVPIANLPTTSALTSTLAATEAAKWLLGGQNPQLQGQIRTIHTVFLTIETHAVLCHADCPVCGGFQGLRSVTLDAVVSPITGIAAELDEVHREPGLVICQARSGQWLCRGRDGGMYFARRDTFHGSGETGEEARTNCLGEAVERYSAQYHGQKLHSASLYHLGSTAIDPRALLLYSDQQHRNRAAWNAGQPEFHRIGVPFDPAAETSWAAANWFTSGDPVFVPAGFCYMGFVEPFCGADSNGCAAAPSWEEAVLRGLLELIERDAVALWWYSRARRPLIKPSSWSHRIVCVNASLQQRGYGMHLLDLTTDCAIPVCLAVCSRGDGGRVVLGSAAAAEPESAAWRAVLSAAGVLLGLELGGVLPQAKDQELLAHWLSSSTLDTDPYLAPLANTARDLNELPQLAGDTSHEQLLHCVNQVESLGLRVAVLDLTRPELRIPAARVMVPGLRHWWARFAPGRLYDTPVRLGWIPEPLTESELNPVPFVL
jgi:bacteriocin biosynthesis cyclodehydratase domain-containing protein